MLNASIRNVMKGYVFVELYNWFDIFICFNRCL